MRLPVDRIRVALILESGEAISGDVFLAPGDPASSVLSEGEPFVPVAVDKKVRLVARDAIASLAVDIELACDPDVQEQMQRAAVRLKNGVTIEGELRWVPHAGYRRTVDMLNLASRAIVVHGTGVTTYIIKAHVAWVEEC
jgi:hypothetical protein